jgi:hypothetical protein
VRVLWIGFFFNVNLRGVGEMGMLKGAFEKDFRLSGGINIVSFLVAEFRNSPVTKELV